MLNEFLLVGTIFFALGAVEKLWAFYQVLRIQWAIKRHDSLCDECAEEEADKLMAETFESMRKKDE